MAHVEELGQRLNELVLERDAHIEALARRLLLRHLLVEALKSADELVEVARQHRSLAQAECLRQLGAPAD